MKLAVLGTGYVGIVTAVVFADFGNDVWGLDIDKKRVASLKQGKSPIYEPQLQEFLKRGLKAGRLHFTTDYSKTLRDVEVIFICVGTPPDSNGEADLSYVFSATKSIAKHLKKKAIIVLKSTVPPGVHEQLERILKKYCKVEHYFASVPEFLREGSAIADTLKPSRIIIGADGKEVVNKLLELHAPINGERVVCDIISAQMIKYAANAFLATKISFANGVARVCDLLKADVKKVMQGLGLDPRIGREFLFPGLGYGGSCFPKDVKAFVHLAKKAGYDFRLLEEVDQINLTQVDYVIDKAEKFLGSFQDKVVGLWGLAFKPDTDDLREARSLVLISNLLGKGAKIQAYDPVAMVAAKKIFAKKIMFKTDAYEAAKNADVIFLVTEWNEFKKLDLQKVKKLMKGKLLIDGRNLYDPRIVKEFGFTYQGVGRR